MAESSCTYLLDWYLFYLANLEFPVICLINLFFGPEIAMLTRNSVPSGDRFYSNQQLIGAQNRSATLVEGQSVPNP